MCSSAVRADPCCSPPARSFARRTLLDAASKHSIGDLQKVTTYWRQRVERERVQDGPDQLRERRRLH